MDLDPTVQPLLARQVNAEQYAYLLYTGLASWADGQAFPGLQAWAAAQAADELAHAARFLGYLNDRLPAGAGAVLSGIATPPAPDTYAGALQLALDAERAVSAALVELAQAAAAVADHATVLIAQRQLLDEQVPSEKAIGVYLQRVARGAPLDLLDGELYEEAA